MAIHNDIGKKGEELASKYLIENGYKILETNWRFKKSEIDIIAQKGNDLVFVEVKTRTSTFFQEPEKSVTLKKQKLLFIAAHEYSSSVDVEINIRFDIISVLLKSKTIEVNHIEDAFYPVI